MVRRIIDSGLTSSLRPEPPEVTKEVAATVGRAGAAGSAGAGGAAGAGAAGPRLTWAITSSFSSLPPGPVAVTSLACTPNSSSSRWAAGITIASPAPLPVAGGAAGATGLGAAFPAGVALLEDESSPAGPAPP